MEKSYLKSVYGLDTSKKVKSHYDDWAASYDAEVGDNGYQTPRRLALLLADAVDDKTAPVLDYGCGTGVSGLALKAAGFDILDGMDISEGMLEQARTKGIYHSLAGIDPDNPGQLNLFEYRAVAAVGVISAGAAPPGTLDTLMQALEPGALLGFSYNDHTLEDSAYMDRLEYWQSGGRSREITRDYGEHLPSIGLKSMIYVIEKT